ncbi:hypothetical protein WISP_119415 [Willisornis vidua]|uniref:Acyl-CoA dehydrogenase/oxidase N-terminal domain-containing protein n=1 Tax=Willisornis vidua TaxID=1566151 RepID=A0ABQ9CYR4_9PASS|nr:hypothetical protein WISP_119415 [Willisornis vidua]
MALRVGGRWVRLGSALRGGSSGPRHGGDTPQHRDLRAALRKVIVSCRTPWYDQEHLPNPENQPRWRQGALAGVRYRAGAAVSRRHPPLNYEPIINKEINPFVDKWEEEGQFPAHKVFKTLGQAGFLGVDKPIGSNWMSSGPIVPQQDVEKGE